MRSYETYDSPVGGMLLAASEAGITGVYFIRQKHFPGRQGWTRNPDHRHLRRAKAQLEEYFAGRRKAFELALDPHGTDYQKAIWRAIATVGFGRTISYGELARKAGYPGAARAAGAATGRNPIGIIVPCHRIVGADGSLTGYAGGLAKKRALLALEGVLTGELLAG